MAIHCEKVVKRLTDKHFKAGAALMSKSASKSDFILIILFILFTLIILRIEKGTVQKQETFAGADDDEMGDGKFGDSLNLQEKIAITDKIRKLTNEGLAAVSIIYIN